MNVGVLTDTEVELSCERLFELYLKALDEGRPVTAADVREVLEEVAGREP